MPQLMNAFPASAETQVTLANWRSAPFNGWAFHHIREIMPTADIAHEPDHIRPLPRDIVDLSGFRIDTGAGRSLTFQQFLTETNTDGLVILKGGRLMFEHHAHGMTARSPHILMSVTKSMLGLLAGILADQGQLDCARPVTDYVPEIAGTAYAGATVRDLLDMRVGIAFAEDYLATSGPIVEYRKSTGWNPLGPGETPSDLRSFFSTLTSAGGAHGGPFNYVSPNSDLLGWVIERATGRRFADVMAKLLWQPMGAADAAYITVDRLGAPRCAGGMCATTADLARIGQLLVDGGKNGMRQVLPAAWIEDIFDAGDAKAWDAGNFAPLFPGIPMHYRGKWYVERGAPPLLYGVGIHGQNLFIDRRNGIVIAKFSSQALPLDAERIALTARAVAAIRRALTTG